MSATATTAKMDLPWWAILGSIVLALIVAAVALRAFQP
jgi:hypothetical protein